MGLEEGLDVSEYVRQGMDPEQIRAILQGYRTDIDYTLYAKPWYTSWRNAGNRLKTDPGSGSEKSGGDAWRWRYI